MFEKLEIFRLAHAMASHAGKRQAVIARNMANADTPGYAAQDIPAFKTLVDRGGGTLSPRATRMTHLNGDAPFARLTDPGIRDRAGARQDPNGNSVALETEMIHAVNVMRQHSRAVSIYKSSLNILRTAVGRR